MQGIYRFLFTATITAPTFLSLGLIGIVRNSTMFIESWSSLFNKDLSISGEWWLINLSIFFALISLIGVKLYICHKSKLEKESKTIEVKSYESVNQVGSEQFLSSIIPWLALSIEQVDYITLFFCMLIQCSFTVIACYKNNGFNLLCSMWGYRYYKVYTEENTYILLSNRCIKNKNEIKGYIELTDYDGLMITK